MLAALLAPMAASAETPAPPQPEAAAAELAVTLPNGEVVAKPTGAGAVMGAAGKNTPRAIAPSALGAAPQSQTLSEAAPKASGQPAGTEGMPAGMDVSGWQQNVDWRAAWNGGARFAYVKASEGPWTLNDYFAQQYNGAAGVGMLRGAYHFARPNLSSGANQAAVLVDSGGGWSADGMTLPGVLDLEANGSDSSGTCFGMTPSQLVAWTKDFTITYKALTGRDAVIYTAYYFWQDCLGKSSIFSQANPLWIAAYGAAANDVWMPGNWPQYTFWQFSSTGPFVGDSNVFNGGMDQLKTFAGGALSVQAAAIQAAAAANPSIGTGQGQVNCGLANNGCFRMFTNGAIVWSPASGAQVSPYGAIRDAWGGQGFENGALSYPSSGILCGLAKSGCFQAYLGGEIFSSPGSGAQVSRAGEIRTAYRNSGAENGPMGYPVGSETCGLAKDGCYQLYEGGAIIWSPSTGAQLSPFGPIRTAWGAAQFESGSLGYPTGSIVCGLPNGGCYQAFEGGAVLYSPATGAQASLNGPLRAAWGDAGYQNGSLGYPTGSQVCTPTNQSCYQLFQGGTVAWTAAVGALYVTGGINAGWLASGGATGPLAYPTGTPVCGMQDGGCYQSFQNGYLIWTPATGGQVSLNGPIRDAWQRMGFQGGTHGYPTTGVVCGLKGGGCYQNYQRGAIIWSPATGAQSSPAGAIRDAWQRSAFETGPLAYPTTDVVCGLKGGGCYQNFSGGAIIWSPATGAQLSLNGQIRSAWQARGFENGSLGYPTGPQSCNTGQTTCSQPFQGGKLNWDASRGVWIS